MVVKFQHIKVLLSGSAAAGKSSFCRLLFRHKYSAEYNSTDIMDTKQCMLALTYCMLREEDQMVWLELSPKNQLKHFKSLLVSQMFHPTSGQSIEQEPVANCNTATTSHIHVWKRTLLTAMSFPLPLKWMTQ